MTSFIILKVSLALAVFYFFYRYLLAIDKDFRRNRFYLLGTSILSFVFPWITIPVIQAKSQVLSFAYISKDNPLDNQFVHSEISSFTWLQLLTILYIAGITFFILKTSLSYFNVYRIVRNALHIPLGKFKIVVTPLSVSPFSFFQWIVIPSQITTNHPSYEKMVQHEMVHCRQFHSVDLFIGELLVALQWFNPFAWFLRKSISENLEYLVDDEMLKTGTNAKDYQYSLLSFSMVGLKPVVANNFNTNLLKKRIVMMNKHTSRKHSSYNYMILMVLLIVMALSMSFKERISLNAEKRVAPIIKVSDRNNFLNIEPREKIKTYSSSSSTKIDDVKALESFLGYVMSYIAYPQEAIDVNLESNIYLPVLFKSGGAEIPTDFLSEGVTLKQVVVVAYKSSETLKLPPADKNSKEVSYLQNEVARVIKSYKSVPKELVGKTYILSVKFILEEKNPTLTESIDGGLQFRNSDNKDNSEPTFILNDEKIISKEEMKMIKSESISSVNVITQGVYKSEKLGVIPGNVIAIKTK